MTNNFANLLLSIVAANAVILIVAAHPVWDLSLIDGENDENNTINFADELDVYDPNFAASLDDSRGIGDIIDSLISGRITMNCSTGQGQRGRCVMGSCSTLGPYSSVSCQGRFGSMFKCCPYEAAAEVIPVNASGCGVRPVRTANLIVGGHEAIAHSWPWAIALYRVNNGRRYYLCGGTLINNRYVLTAAHCVKRPLQAIRADDYIVKIGAHHLGDSGRFVSLEEILIHENYSPTVHNDDIALLRLAETLNFTADSRIGAACLPAPNKTETDRVGRMATMIGWGVRRQSDLAASPSLYEVQIPISDREKCRATYTDLMGRTAINWNNVVCASYPEGGKDTCQGDSGGSMTIADADDIYSQVGVVSFGYGCAQKGYPGVYTYVPNYLTWIGGHMRNE